MVTKRKFPQVLVVVLSLSFLLSSFLITKAAAPVILTSPPPQAINIIGPGAQITWTTDSAADSRVDYGISSSYGLSSDSRCDAGGNVTSHCVNLTGLTPSTVYFFKIKSTNASGTVEFGGLHFTSASAPAAPSGLNAAVSGSSVNLTWQNNSTNATRYEVYRQISGGVWTTLTNQLVASAVAYSDLNVPAGTYSYQVASCNSSGCSPSSSATANVSGGDTVAPSVPAGLVATKDNYNEVDLNWTASTDSVGVSGYYVWRSANAVWSQIGQPTTNSFMDFSVSPSTSYYYYVVAYDAAGNKSASSSALFLNTPASPAVTSGGTSFPPPPNVPTNLTAALSGSSVNLTWQDNSNNETRFEIYRQPPGGIWNYWNQVGAGITSYSDLNLVAGTYSYQVAACNGTIVNTGCSSGSNIAGPITVGTVSNNVATTTTDTVPPTAPTGVVATPVSSYQANLSWTASTDNVAVGGYKIYRNGNYITFVQTTSYSDISLTPGATYSYYVVSYDTSGNASAQSPVVSITTPPAIISASSTSALPTVDLTVDGVHGTVYRVAPASYTISWNTTGAKQCVPQGTWGGGDNKSISGGSQYFTGVSEIGTKTYTLACSNDGGSASATAYVIIASGFVPSASSTSAVFLRGTVTDSAGNPVVGAFVRVFREDFSLNFSSVSAIDGSFSLALPSGTYFAEVSPPSGRSDLVKSAPIKFSVASGETKVITLQFGAVAKTITGSASFFSGTPIVDAEVGAYSSASNQWTSTFVDSNGKYTLNVSGGKWQMGMRPRDSSVAKWTWSGPPQEVLFANDASAESQTVNFVIPVFDAQVTVHTVDQAGNVVPGAGVVLDASSVSQPGTAAFKPPSQFGKGDSNGLSSFTARAGTYYIRAFLPGELGFFNPEEQSVVVVAGQTKDVSLVFRKREAVTSATVVLRGVTKFDDGTPTDAFVWAWSDKGINTQLRSSPSGEFSFPVFPGRWHVGAGKELNGFPFKSSELTVDIQNDSVSIEVVLSKSQNAPLPQPVSVGQPATQQITAQAQDGAKVTLPPGATPGSGTVNLEVKPTIEAPSQPGAKVVSTVYDVKVKDASGNAVTSLQKEIEITLPYKDEDLRAQKITEDQLVPSFFDESTGSWVKVDNYTIDKVRKVVILRVKHLTRFALVAAADITPPNAPANVTVKSGGAGELVLSWVNPASDFDHVRVYRSTAKGALGVLAYNNVVARSVRDSGGLQDGTAYYYTVRAVDPAGNESTNAAQIYAVARGTSSAPVKSLERNLRLGSRGEDVKLLQRILIKENVYPGRIVTGVFGQLTRAAVIRFQEKYADEILKSSGLDKGNGFVGPATRKKLNQLAP